MKLSRTPGEVERPAPALGEHTEDVLRDAGFGDEEIDSLLSSGAAAGPNEAAQQREFLA